MMRGHPLLYDVGSGIRNETCKSRIEDDADAHGQPVLLAVAARPHQTSSRVLRRVRRIRSTMRADEAARFEPID